MKQIKVVAIITARGGSKGLPRKNVLLLNGKPLISFTIDAALQSGIFDKVIVTTDDDEIKKVSLMFGAQVIDRPKDLATDHASSLDVIEHSLLELLNNGDEITHFVLLQPTSPLRNYKNIIESWSLYLKGDYSSLVSVESLSFHPQKTLLIRDDGLIYPTSSWEDLTKPRQELAEAVKPNGAIYISQVDRFLQTKNLFVEPFGVYKMTKKQSIDIDNLSDLKKAEIVFNES
jgi:CMP-N-acetylneuraminic acid synthetase